MCANFLTVARKSLVGESGEVFAGGSSFRRAEKSRDPGGSPSALGQWDLYILSYLTRDRTHTGL